ncbi:MAG: UTP--glucose-1-phosphate uridylyltransferase [Gammaproteobacteria bacterium]|nr:UTP--glucose-1-phosphate uridylyltransferase [Gammaproteobacteria bacterium]
MDSSIKTRITEIMAQEGLPNLCAAVFLAHYKKLLNNEQSVIRENLLRSASRVDNLEQLPDNSKTGLSVLGKTVSIKLNGGLGTGMGLEKAKSLLPAKNGLRFLDIIIRQILSQRHKIGCDLPLVFMNSFSTEQDTLAVLNDYPELQDGQKNIPLTFIQNKVPKILADSLEPAEWPADPAKTWCPPGHGDIYTALQTTGILQQLLDAGIRYAFISNSDNLGADIDLSVLGHFAEQDVSFMMEVADRTAADKKGGHLAETRDGQLILREVAQCHVEDEAFFQDINRYKYFNTNNLWLRLDRLQELLEKSNGIVDLPLIQNVKTVDPRDADSPKVIQLETAMGSAISCFGDSLALRIPKSRFAPIKTTGELLGLWSNAFILDQDYLIKISPDRKNGFIVISLDAKYYKKIDDLKARFPHGPPNLLDCQQLTIIGDVLFEANVTISGDVTISNQTSQQHVITKDTVIEQSIQFT